VRAALAVALSLALSQPAIAQAADPPRIALLAAVPGDPLAGRIEAELRAVGFQVTRSLIPPGLPIDRVVDDALAAGAPATVIADGRRTDVWIGADGAARVGLHQELEVDRAAGAGSDPQSVLALRTVEFVRISLGVATPPAAPPAAPPAPPPPATPLPRPEGRARSTALGVSSGVLVAAGGVGPFVVVGASLRVPLVRRFGLELCGYAPLNESPQSDPSGTARTAVWLAGGGAFVAWDGGRRLSGEVGAGALAAVVRSTGDPAAGDVGTTDQAVGMVLYGRAAGRLRLGQAWALGLDLLSGGTVVRPVVSLANHDVAAWGHLLVAGLAGVDVRF